MNLRTWMLAMAILAAAAPAGAVVRVYLPRDIAVTGTELTLGAVAVVVCDEPEQQKQVEALAMGRTPASRETLVVTRATVLSRLAASGIAAPQVRLTGAEQVSVRRQEKLFSADEVVRSAQTLLKNLPATAASAWRADMKPPDLVAGAGAGDVQLQANLTGTPAGDTVTVRVVATDGKEELARVDVTFHRAYTVRQAVATEDIAAGAPLTEKNTRIEEVEADRPSASAFLPAAGAVAARAIARGTVIQPAHLDASRSEALVRRNQTVVMRIAGEGFSISTLAQALQDGRPGEYVKVRNVDSNRIVTGKVMPDGSVQPRFDEVNR